MSQNTGTLVIAPIRVNDSGDVYPSAVASEILGGWKAVADAAALAALPVERLETGCVAFQIDTTTPYYWDGAAWQPLAAGGASVGALTGPVTKPNGSLATTLIDSYVGHIVIPSNQAYTIDEYASAPGTINRLASKLSAGTLTLAVAINGTPVTGLSAVAVSSVQDLSNASAANVYVAGDRITLTASANASGANLAYTLKVTRA
jgi:hypothetical protein